MCAHDSSIIFSTCERRVTAWKVLHVWKAHRAAPDAVADRRAASRLGSALAFARMVSITATLMSKRTRLEGIGAVNVVHPPKIRGRFQERQIGRASCRERV